MDMSEVYSAGVTWRLPLDGCKCEKISDKHDKCRERFLARHRAAGHFLTRNCFNDHEIYFGMDPWECHERFHGESICDGPEWAGHQR